jgi:hypothetical protein
MSIETRHFLLTQEGYVREFTAEQAAMIAAGADRLPEYADRRVRYLQVTFDAEHETEIQVRTAGAAIQFDESGRLTEAVPPAEDETFTRFEHETCVQWALRDLAPAELLRH